VDVVRVPESRGAHALAVAGASQPACARRVERHPFEVAEESDRIPLDVTSQAASPRLVVHSEPQERHGPDRLAHLAFQCGLPRPHVCRRAATPAQGGGFVTVASNDGSAYYQPEDRAPVISTAGALRATMLREPRPQLRR